MISGYCDVLNDAQVKLHACLAIKALKVDGEHIKIGCIFTGNLPVFPDFYRYFHL